jgi:hypothetical protein
MEQYEGVTQKIWVKIPALMLLHPSQFVRNYFKK